MKPGTVPAPTAVQKAKGVTRADRLSVNEPQPSRERPMCPTWVDAGAKACWREIVPQLDAMGVLTRIDRNAITRYCQLWSRWKAAELSLIEFGSTYVLKDTNGKAKCIQQRPEVSIAHRLALALTRMEGEFGMTPSSRTRIEAVVAPAKQPDEKDKFFGPKIADVG